MTRVQVLEFFFQNNEHRAWRCCGHIPHSLRRAENGAPPNRFHHIARSQQHLVRLLCRSAALMGSSCSAAFRGCSTSTQELEAYLLQHCLVLVDSIPDGVVRNKTAALLVRSNLSRTPCGRLHSRLPHISAPGCDRAPHACGSVPVVQANYRAGVVYNYVMPDGRLTVVPAARTNPPPPINPLGLPPFWLPVIQARARPLRPSQPDSLALDTLSTRCAGTAIPRASVLPISPAAPAPPLPQAWPIESDFFAPGLKDLYTVQSRRVAVDSVLVHETTAWTGLQFRARRHDEKATHRRRHPCGRSCFSWAPSSLVAAKLTTVAIFSLSSLAARGSLLDESHAPADDHVHALILRESGNGPAEHHGRRLGVDHLGNGAAAGRGEQT